MRSRISFTLSFIILGVTGIALASIIIFFPTLALHGQGSYSGPASPTSTQSSQNAIESVSIKSQAPGPGLPIRIKIPKIGVDAALEYVGVTAQGAMAVPKGPDNAAWFDLGPRPGDNGSAVIAGHEGWKNNIQAVFDNLHTLQKGDQIYVTDEKGAVATFVVREVRTYDQNANAGGVFNSTDGKAHLNLITCEGVWNKIQKSYSDRLVVFTDEI